ARDWLESGTCIVSYSDIFYASSAIASLLACAHPLAITYDPNWRALWERRFADPLSDAETFRLDEEGRLREIGNTPASLDDIQGQYMGLLRFEPEGWQEIARLRADMTPEECDRMHLTGTLQRVIAARHVPIHAV